MATIVQIDGVGKVELDDSFKSLSPAQQQSTVDEIANHHAASSASAPDVPVPEGFQRPTAAPVNAQETWLSQHPDQAGSLSHVIGEAYRGLKNGFGDAPLSSSIPSGVPTHLGYIPNPLAVAAEIGGTGLRALGAIPGGVYGAAKGVAESIGLDPTQAEKFGSDIGGMPESVAGVMHTLPPITRNIANPGAFEELAARAKASPVPGMTRTAANAIASVIPESKTTKATKIANILKGDVTQTLSKTASADITAAQEAHDTAAAALADAQRVPTPTSIGIGEPNEMTELGTPAKTAGVDAKQAMEDARHQMDSVLRPKQAEIVADNEANGIKFVDTPAIKQLLADIEPIVKPNVTTASATTNVTDPLTKSLYRRVYNSLISKEVELTPEEAASAKANNLPVQEITDPVTGETTYKRTFDSSFQAAENLRRYLGDAFNKDTGAYGAINSNIKKDMYDLLDKAQTEYVGAAHTDVQKSYAAFTNDLKPYEETTIGKQLTGTQGSTDIPSYTPADISKILLTGDRSKIDQIFKLAASKDRPAIKQSIADAIETAVNGKNRAAVAEMTKTGSPLSDILEHPELKEFRAPINNYVTRLGDAEQAAVTMKNLDLGTFKKGVSEAEKAGRATDVTINAINNAPVKDLPDLLSTHINKLYTDGKFSPEQFKSASEEIKSISKIFDKSKARSKAIAAFKKHALMAAAGASGAGAIYQGYKYVLGE